MDLGSSGKDEEISKPTGDEWSKWLDFNRETISSVVPEESGLFKVHASMKILYIGIAHNLKTTLLDSILDPCISKGQRFSYMVNHGSLENLKTELLKDYALRHNGLLPACMESVM
ncbi:MAG: hypothetical protein WBX01_09365 [Nitrososphaeraceae archaeon]|jgi:hypothetical protein